jgi:hypothetical protein
MKWRADKLHNVDSFFDFWDKSDPYIRFLKIRNDNSLVEVHRTEVVKDNLSPSWQPFRIWASRLINPNKQGFKYPFLELGSKSGTGRRTAATA